MDRLVASTIPPKQASLHYKAMVMNTVKGGKFECWVEILTLTLTSCEVGLRANPVSCASVSLCNMEIIAPVDRVSVGKLLRRGTCGTSPPLWRRYVLTLTKYCRLFSKSVLPVCTPTRSEKGSFPPPTSKCYFHFVNLCLKYNS